MSRGTHSSGYFPNPWRDAGELTAGVPVPSVALQRRSRVRRALAPLWLLVASLATLAGFAVGTVATSAPVTVPGQPLTGAHSHGDRPILSGDRATVVTTSP